MRFVHLADTHLGFRQYGLYEREADFYQVFEEAVAQIIRERPDFVVHSGDLFDFPKPQPRALWVAQRCFARLREKGIPVYAITGNHDTLMRRGSLPPQVLYDEFNVKIITEENPFYLHKGVFVGGSPYISKFYSTSLKETLNILSEKAKKHQKSILLLHQGIEKYLPFDFELKLEEIPANFNYYAMGHIHSRIVRNFGNGKLAYPGSTELWSISEYEDAVKNGKGFFVVDISGDEPDVQPVTIPLARDIIREKIRGSEALEKIGDIKKRISSLRKKPLLYLELDGEGYERPAVQQRLASELSELALSLRISYISEKIIERKSSLDKAIDIAGMIGEALEDREKARLANLLFAALSEGNDEKAVEEAEKYFECMKSGGKESEGKKSGGKESDGK